MSIIYVDPIYEPQAHDALRKESRYADRDLAMQSAMTFINTLVQSRDRRRAESSEGQALGAYNQAMQHPEQAPQIAGGLADQAQNYQDAPSIGKNPMGWLGSKFGGGTVQGVNPAIASKYVGAINAIPGQLAKQGLETEQAVDIRETRPSRIAENYATANAQADVDPELKGYGIFRNDVNALSSQIRNSAGVQAGIAKALAENDFGNLQLLASMSPDQSLKDRLTAADAMPDVAGKKAQLSAIDADLKSQMSHAQENIKNTEKITDPMLRRMTDRAAKKNADYWAAKGMAPDGVTPLNDFEEEAKKKYAPPSQSEQDQETAGQTYKAPSKAPTGKKFVYSNGVAREDADAPSIDEFHKLAGTVPPELRDRVNAIYMDKNSNWGAKLWKLRNLLGVPTGKSE